MGSAAGAQSNDLGEGRLSARMIDELVGICRVMALETSLTRADVRTLDKWLSKYRALEDYPLVDEICEAVAEAFIEDFSASSLEALHGMLRQFVGGASINTSAPTSLPFDTPFPALKFVGVRYCLTGTFKYGTRNECIHAIEQRGGEVKPIAAKTNVLVIGSDATESWKHSNYGTKINSAVYWRNQGYPIVIVSEEHWIEALGQAPLAPRPPSRGSSTSDLDGVSDEADPSDEEDENIKVINVSWASLIAADNNARAAKGLPPRGQHPVLSDLIAKDREAGLAEERFLRNAELAGRAVRQLRRLAWYALPLLVIFLSLWTIAAHFANTPRAPLPPGHVSATK